MSFVPLLFCLQPVYALVREVEELVVLGQAGTAGPFMVVSSAFIDASSLSFKNISVRLAKVSNIQSSISLTF